LLDFPYSEPHVFLAQTGSTVGHPKEMCCMRALTIEAGQLVHAHGLYNALSAFHLELSGDNSNGHRISVELGSDTRMVAVLEAIQAHVTARTTARRASRSRDTTTRFTPSKLLSLRQPNAA
jgi:hypothetical protein